MKIIYKRNWFRSILVKMTKSLPHKISFFDVLVFRLRVHFKEYHFAVGDFILAEENVIFALWDISCAIGNILRRKRNLFHSRDCKFRCWRYLFSLWDIFFATGDIIFSLWDIIFATGDIIFVVVDIVWHQNTFLYVQQAVVPDYSKYNVYFYAKGCELSYFVTSVVNITSEIVYIKMYHVLSFF